MSVSKFEKWEDLSELQRLEFISDPENVPDCHFIVGKATGEIKRISCHKKVLSQCSDVFSSMFSGNYLESKQNCEIILDDVQPIAFQYFVNFIYFNVIPFEKSIKELLQLIYLSDKYMIRMLNDICHQFINDNLPFKVTIPELVAIFGSPLLPNFYEKINLTEFNMECTALKLCSDIYNLRAPRFVLLLTKIYKNLSAFDLFVIIENYVEKNLIPERKDKNQIIIDRMISMVRFQDMTAKEFVDRPMKSSLLSVHTKLDKLINISNKIIEKQTNRKKQREVERQVGKERNNKERENPRFPISPNYKPSEVERQVGKERNNKERENPRFPTSPNYNSPYHMSYKPRKHYN
ncbi:kelch-like protein 41 [Teleopsis dalmanni]|uniref:kelch-like protein 41 n=1 Tax=Teleopsis dalmanni TaxID=139649 RepID=UPI0018CF4315|nr:kelch-like protein 41 [Teleopsis dalmanni]